jgi:hypothetical protein
MCPTPDNDDSLTNGAHANGQADGVNGTNGSKHHTCPFR